jgi:hypothetical protein
MSVSSPVNSLSDTHPDARRFLRRLTAATTGGEFIDGYVLGGSAQRSRSSSRT